ncbi:hypothetical protein Tco_1484616 [Tanacetum coccineum]
MDINIDALYNILKQNQGDVNEAMGHKKKAVVVTSDPLALVAEKTKVSKRKEKVVVQSESEGSDDEDIKQQFEELLFNFLVQLQETADTRKDILPRHATKQKVKTNNYYKTKMLLAKKDSDEQVLLAEDQAWMESSSDSDQEINANMVFMAKMENVLSDSEESSSILPKKPYARMIIKNIHGYLMQLKSASKIIMENHIVSQQIRSGQKVDH